MGRWADAESDAERLPEGFQRIGYDADTETYTFRAPDGQIYESASGNRYGELYPQGQRPLLSAPEVEYNNAQLKKSNSESVKMMLPFALLAIVSLLVMFRFLGSAGGSQGDPKLPQVHCAEGTASIQVKEGETCWKIGEVYGVSVEELLQLEGNEGVDCDTLAIGQGICVPA
ncbi:carbohydrate-binding module family 50 protein [Karstenula rhodostoma CBS 690.94]|uniref:Carbohydrate-binding module family 50 protein n=1 Tax=Karstenula rhodostoma CBS 690.94 TaxID=1392251 RepID=A0A9P4U3T8_9PLEO|nr:carbohydrate-binding module family 50 protein [Karstenula rhodostoma CBS 690.94]